MTDVVDMAAFIDRAVAIVEAAEIAPGVYRRYAGGAPDADPYGCADAANILYTVGRFPRDAQQRQRFVDAINGLQDDDGMWREATHHEIHTTAHCIAALELFDAPPARPPLALRELCDPDRMAQFLDDLDWRDNPWPASHRGAGLHAALVLSGMADRTWRDRYIGWLTDNADPQTGLWRRGDVAPIERLGIDTVFPHLAGTFHYLFALEYERAPLAHPGAMIETCLRLRTEDPFPLGKTVGFAEIDWVYCLNRAGRQTSHRDDARRQALAAFARDYGAFLNDPPAAEADKLNDLHFLFGVTCALAELQTALPGMIRTEHPLRLVLDRRPFI